MWRGTRLIEVIKDNLGIIIAGFLSVTGIVGYWIKTKIDAKVKKRQRVEQFEYDDLRALRSHLQEFLGKPLADLKTMHNVGDTWDSNWRREKAASVGEWVRGHRSIFPDKIETELTRLGNMAGTMISDEGMKQAMRFEWYEQVTKSENIIKEYLAEIDGKLRRK